MNRARSLTRPGVVQNKLAPETRFWSILRLPAPAGRCRRPGAGEDRTSPCIA